MRKIKCIVVEDEPLAMERLCRFIQKIEIFEINAKCISVIELNEALLQNEADVLFLDIQLAGENSIDFARKSQLNIPIIFTTAYDEFALESFELNVLDYLLKPFDFDRFQKAVNKIKLTLTKTSSTSETLIISSEHSKIKLSFSDILYVESMKDYVKIYIKSQIKPILTRQNLKTFQKLLPPKNFIRVHRSFVVSLNEISKVSRQTIELGKIEIPIGNLYKEEFLKHYFN